MTPKSSVGITPPDPDLLTDLIGPDIPAAPASAVERVFDDLLRKILNLELPPDSALFRGELCKYYDVSQTPVREALQRLEAMGLVRIYPQSKTVVTRINIEQLHQNHFLRVALECEVVRTLALAPDEKLLSRLQSLVSMQVVVADDPQQMGFFDRLDNAFHECMYRGAGQTRLQKLIKAHSGHMKRARRLELPREGKTRSVIKGHQAIVDGIRSGEPEQAVRAMREHLAGTISHVEELKEEHLSYFED